MKKTFKIIGMALLAAFMSVNFTACSSDDDDAPANNPEATEIAEKKIVKVEEELKTTTFNYDDNGKLIKVTVEGKDMYPPYTSYTYYTSETWFIWGEDNITTHYQVDNDSYIPDYSTTKYNPTFTLKDGLIKTYLTKYTYNNQTNESLYTFMYNGTKNLVNITREDKYNDYSSHSETSYVWNGDKLVTTIQQYNHKITFTYEGQCQKGYTPLVSIFASMLHVYDDICYLYAAHPEIIGMRTSQLPKSINDGGTTYNFSYEFDEEGYITKIIEGGEEFVGIDGTIHKNDPYIITITWQ